MPRQYNAQANHDQIGTIMHHDMSVRDPYKVDTPLWQPGTAKKSTRSSNKRFTCILINQLFFLSHWFNIDVNNNNSNHNSRPSTISRNKSAILERESSALSLANQPFYFGGPSSPQSHRAQSEYGHGISHALERETWKKRSIEIEKENLMKAELSNMNTTRLKSTGKLAMIML